MITEPLPSNTLRPPSVRPSSARPGAPRLRPDSALPLKEPVTMGKINVIVEHFDKIDDPDEETVIIENTPVDIEEIKPQTDLDLPQEKGQLVEEILKQIGDEEVQISSNEWQIDSEIGGLLVGIVVKCFLKVLETKAQRKTLNNCVIQYKH